MSKPLHAVTLYNPVYKFVVIIFLILSISGCINSLPKPEDASSSLIILSVEVERALGTNNPDVVIIKQLESNKEYRHSSRDGRYYFFANLPKGTYQIKNAGISIKGGTMTSKTGNITTSFTPTTFSAFNFDGSMIQKTTTKLSNSDIAFMAKITAEGTSKMFPPGAIEISDIKISQSEGDKKSTFSYFKKEFKDSYWSSLIK